MRTPTCEELELLSKWPHNKVHSLIDFLEGLWWMADKTITFTEDAERFYLELNTLGWKGNEEIVQALMDNVIFWNRHWKGSKPPGVYSFEFLKDEG